MNVADLVENSVSSKRVAYRVILYGFPFQLYKIYCSVCERSLERVLLHGFTMKFVYKDTAEVVLSQCLSFNIEIILTNRMYFK